MFSQRRLERKVDAANYKLDLILNHLGIQDLPAFTTLDPATTTPAATPVGLAQVDALLAQGKKIQAIKIYREMTGVGLKDAKEAVERRAPY